MVRCATLCAILLLNVGSLLAYRCPGPEWTPRRDSQYCYLFSSSIQSQEISYADAQKVCQQRGGYLTDILSEEEFSFLQSRTPLANVDYWTGLSFESGTWVWGNTQATWNPPSYFDSSSLNGFDQLEDTVKRRYRGVITRSGNNPPKFRAIPSATNGLFGTTVQTFNHFICKANFTAKQQCRTEEGWDFVNGRCWKTVSELLTYQDASTHCTGMGGHLAVPQSDDENQRVLRVLELASTSTAWLGMTFFKTSAMTLQQVTWADGTSAASSSYPWQGGNLNTIFTGLTNDRQYCAFVNKPLLSSQSWKLESTCGERRPFVCEDDLEICPFGWNHHDGRCYQFRFVDDQLATFSDADTECQSAGGNLAVIYDANLQGFFDARFPQMGFTEQGTKLFWIGFTSRSSSSPTQFNWVPAEGLSGSSYVNWVYSGGPPNDASRRCAVIEAKSETGGQWSGKWHTASCDSRVGYICQALPEKAVQVDIVHPVIKCEAPFTLYHDMCYYRQNQSMNWDAANDHCIGLKSTLVEIATGGENSYLANMIEGNSWIGIKRYPYVNADGETDFYRQYASGRNMTSLSFENYRLNILLPDTHFCTYMLMKQTGGIVDTTGQWDFDLCTTARPFICAHRGDFEGTTELPVLMTPECGPGWIYHEPTSHCYRLTFQPVAQSMAAQTCQNYDHNSNLLYITSKEEEDFIRTVVNGQNAYSPNLLSTVDSFWTAMQVTGNDQWHWKYRDSTDKWYIPMGYTHWKEQPNTAQNPSCMYVQKDMRWTVDGCMKERAAICKKRARVAVPDFPTVPSVGANSTYGCPTNWTQSTPACFRRIMTQSTWNEARDACKEYGGGAHLATLWSDTQYRQLAGLFNGAWLGMNSIAQPVDPRVFREDNSVGAHAIYTPWSGQIARPGGGNGPADSNCVAGVHASNDYTIGQYSCNEKRSFVCQIPEQELALNPDDCIKPVHDHGCQRWGYGHGGSCFYMGNEKSSFGTRQLHTFDGAREFCRVNYQADLAVVNSADTQEFITYLLGTWRSEYWIGLHSHSNSFSTFSPWITGDVVSFVNWAAGQPTVGNNRRCAAVHGTRGEGNIPGDWYTDECHERKFPLCQAPREGFTRPTAPTLPSTPAPAIRCPSGWGTPDSGSTHCYKAFYAGLGEADNPTQLARRTWQEAEDACQQYGPAGHLASIKSQSEFDYVKDTVITQKPTDYQYWIGLRETEDGRWTQWSDGQAFSEAGFFDTQSDHSMAGVRDCVALNAWQHWAASGSGWIRQNCEMAWGWVCEIPTGNYDSGQTLPTLAPLPTSNATCGDNSRGNWYYEPKTDNCFFVSNHRESFVNAEAYCNSLDSHLATIQPDNHGFLTTIITRNYNRNTFFWIGLRLTDGTLLTHRWIDGNLGNIFRAWDVNEPDPRGVQGCVVMVSDNGKWRDDYCTRPNGYQFICRKNNAPLNIGTTVAPTVSENWGCPSACGDPSSPRCLSFRHSCYYFSPHNPEDLKTWDEALDACHDFHKDANRPELNADLVSIHDKLEQDFLVAHLAYGRINRWTGLHEDWDQSIIHWTDNTPVDYSNWNGVEPLQTTTSECIMMYGETGRAGKWNDELCSVKAGYICKMKKHSSYPPLNPNHRCDHLGPEFRHLNGACFGILPVPSGVQPDAVCTERCARSAAITNPYENAFFHTMFAKMNNYANHSDDRIWLGGKSRHGRLFWDAGCFPGYNNIAFYHADVQNDTCIAMDYGGRWRTEPCGTPNNFVACEKREEECHRFEPEIHGTCPEGFSAECHSHCLKLSLPTSDANTETLHKKSWEESKRICTDLGAVLLSIRTERDQRCIEKYMEQAAGPIWLGLHERINTQTNQGTNVWQWLDDTLGELHPGSYNNWDINEPSPGGTSMWDRESCSEVKLNGKWNSVICGQGATRGYICEVLKTPYPANHTRPTRIPPAHTTATPVCGYTPPTTPSPQPTSAASHGGSVGTTRNPIDTIPPSSTLGGGAIAGIVIAVVVLIPGLTIGAYIFWRRSVNPLAALTKKSQQSYRRGDHVDDQVPVVEDFNDVSYT